MKSDSECKYCGGSAVKKYGFCPECWQRLCGERQEMIILVGHEHGLDCEHFEHYVELGILYLKWLDEEDAEELPKKPAYDPEDPDWWKK